MQMQKMLWMYVRIGSYINGIEGICVAITKIRSAIQNNIKDKHVFGYKRPIHAFYFGLFNFPCFSEVCS